jgi:hypothetical protein
MPSKKHKPEEIIGKLREVEIVLAQGELDGRSVSRIGEANIVRPYSSLGPPAPETATPPYPASSSVSLHLRPP